MITITKSLYAIVMLCITILLIQILQICLTKSKGGVLEGFDADESSLLGLSSSKQITKGDLKRIEFSLEKILKKVKEAASCLTSSATTAKKGVRFMEQDDVVNVEEEESEEEDEGNYDYEYEDNGAIVEGFIEGFTQNCAEM